MYEIEIADRQSQFALDTDELQRVAKQLLSAEQVKSATISLAFVDDPEIHQINRDYLNHDYPTDVISFLLNERLDLESSALDEEPRGQGQVIEGQVVVSTETAVREAENYNWSADAETVLYVIHGLLHLAGYDDLSDAERMIMRRREREILTQCGLKPPGSDMDEPPGEAKSCDRPLTQEDNRS
ncbi:MAG: rRNA maturation RNase YbeY [Planctomycetaceae bacterium]|nr:rRNA maturation RNase YbeY [Planctomycetaceae bacterium]